MLERVYHELYTPAFPRAEDRESLDSMQAAFDRDGSGDLVFILAGKDMDAPAAAAIQGMSTTQFFPAANVATLYYIAIGESLRGQGMGQEMVRRQVTELKKIAAAHGRRLCGFFLESNNPAAVKASEDSMDPAERLATFRRMGAREIPVNLVYPVWKPGGERCDDYKLQAFPVDGRYPTREACLAYIKSLYERFEGAFPPDDPDVKRMTEQLMAWEGFKDIDPCCCRPASRSSSAQPSI